MMLGPPSRAAQLMASPTTPASPIHNLLASHLPSRVPSSPRRHAATNGHNFDRLPCQQLGSQAVKPPAAAEVG